MSVVDSLVKTAFPWIGAVKIIGAIGGAVAILGLVYLKGAGDKNAHWLEKENTRIAAEAEETIKGLTNAHRLNLLEAKETSAKIARAEERALQAGQRAESAERRSNQRRIENDRLSNELQESQKQAAAAGDLSGNAILPAGVRDQLANRLDELCRRRSSDCGSAEQDSASIQDAPGSKDAKILVGEYPQ